MINEGSSDNLDQSLSAFVDNEATEMEMHRLLKAGETNEELIEKWRRYHIAGSILRKDSNINVNVDIASRVKEAMQGESVYSAAKSNGSDAELDEAKHAVATEKPKRTWRESIVQSAVAASVAVACVIGFQQFSVISHDTQAVVSNSIIEAPNPSVEPQAINAYSPPEGFDLPLPRTQNVAAISESTVGPAAPSSTPRPQLTREQQRALLMQIDQLMIQHAETVRANGSFGFLPFTRVAPVVEETSAK